MHADTALPPLDGTHVVASELVDEFHRDGHTVVRGLATADEVAAYRPAIEEAVQRAAANQRPLGERDTYGKAFLQVPNLCAVDATVKSFTYAARFARVAAALLGVEGVRLYHDQALFKEPGGGYTPWHQDQTYWPFDTDRAITMWMPLVDVPAEVGSMTFVNGSHREGSLGEWVIGDQSEAEFGSMVTERGLSTGTHGEMQAGDATFHTGWTLHRAPANGTDLMRSVMTIIYVADGARVGEIDSPFRAFDQALWLGGAPTGSLIDGPGNPLLWPVS
jgi:ectoine hydroxylase-related dioxygenase (phytanoyl-CoA dioxygenase family)